MNIIKVSQLLFTLSNLLVLIATNRSLTFPFYLDYFIKIILLIILFNKFNKYQIRLLIISLFIALYEILISFTYDSHNPSLLVANSIITYLIYNNLFTNLKLKQILLSLFSSIALILCLPELTPVSMVQEVGDNIIILRNIPIYLLGIILNISILNLSRIISRCKYRKINIIYALYLFLITSLALYLAAKYYFVSLGGLANILLAFICLLLINLYLLSKFRFFKILFPISISTIVIVFFTTPLFDAFLEFMNYLWNVNTVVQGLLVANPRVDVVGFLNCFFEYPLGTGFYGMESLCKASFEWRRYENFIQPHSAVVSFLLAYPIINFIFLFLIIVKNDFRNYLISNFIFALPQRNNINDFYFIAFARYVHTINFLIIILISELIFKFPLF